MSGSKLHSLLVIFKQALPQAHNVINLKKDRSIEAYDELNGNW